MDVYAAAWHIQWLEGTLTRVHPKSMACYLIALELRFEEKDKYNEADADVEKVSC